MKFKHELKQNKNDFAAKWAQFLFVTLLVLLVIFPALVFFIQSIFSFSVENLSLIFFKITTRAFLFSAFQALLSAGLTVFFGWILACALLLLNLKNPIHKFLDVFFDFLGSFVFSLPSLFVALVIFSWSRSFSIVPSQGLGAIILAHVIFNIVFMAHSLKSQIQSWLDSDGRDIVSSAFILGMSLWKLFVFFLPKIFKSDLRSWFYYVGFLSLSSFSTLLLLGGGPTYSSIEVLLYYSLLNEFGGGRILVLVCLQLLLMTLGLNFYRKAFSNNSNFLDRNSASSSSSWSSSSQTKYFLGAISPRFASIVQALIFMGTIGIIAVFAISLASVLSANSWSGLFAPELRAPILGTLVFSTASMLGSAFLFYVAIFMGSEFRRIGLFCWILSPTLMMAFWFGAGFDRFTESTTLRLILLVMAFVWLRLPWMCLWIEERFMLISKEQFESARLLGAPEKDLILRIFLPQSRDIFFRSILVSGFFAIGELGLVSLFAPQSEFLSFIVQRRMQSYDFNAMAPVIALLFALSFVFFLLREGVLCRFGALKISKSIFQIKGK